ncbi:response regulator [Arenibacter algicola]|uniref:response regulator n=1 Tax=Arenibacter algicola TaxID=616991 RepID=UPI001C066DA3|nr:response regulator [Arenibacter algicola]MBU2905938.1 response regulator [Arenibacter algicola]
MTHEKFNVANYKLNRIALVDDDQDDRLLFKEAFEELKIKAELFLFSNGLNFIDHLSSGIKMLPELLFLDLNMPVMNGLECLKYLRTNASFKDMFVAIYSTSTAITDLESTSKYGANMFIKKPNNFSELTYIINKSISIHFQHVVSGNNQGGQFPLIL